MRLLMRLIANLFKTLLILALLGGAALLALLLLWQQDLRRVDDLNVLEYGGKATVVDASGQVIGALTPSLSSGARVNRDLLKQGQMSSWLRKAVVTSEDTRFFEHGGLDPRGLLRAIVHSATGDQEGGSTITQQVVRSTVLADIGQEKTLTRKLKEALLSVQVERRFSKEEILTAYLNVVYWGVGRTDLLGAQDAARTYFGLQASQLNLAQSAYLATLLPNARRYNNYPAYRPLIKSILNRMVKEGRATRAEADAAWKYPLRPVGWTVRYDAAGTLTSATLSDPSAKRDRSPAPQVRFADGFLDAVERDLSERLGRSVLYRSDVTVYTTMNRQAQTSAEAASRQAALPYRATLGLALLNPKNGDVTALVGQKLGDGVLEEWNNATRARRQVGSSIKPLLYTLALSKGWKQSDTLLDAPIGGDYQPKNYSGSYSGGRVTLRYALDHSLNLPTVRLAQQLGLNSFVSKLRELGLSPAPDTGLPLAIGALEASPLQMAAAYAPFANGGVYYAPRLITKVTEGGKTLLTVTPSGGQRVWDEQTAYLGLDLIKGVVDDLTPGEGGLGWKARIEGREVGGKTGTTNDVRDLWFAGVTPGLSAAVWVGRSDNASLPGTAYSGDVAAPVWQTAVSGALRGQALTQFTPPAQIEFRRVRGVQMAFKTEQGGGFLGGLFGGNPAPATGQDQAQGTPDQASQDQAVQDQAAQDQAARDRAAQDQAAREQEQADQAQQQADQEAQQRADELAAQQAADQQAAQDQADQQAAADQAAADQATQSQAAQDQAAQAQAAQAQAAQAQAAQAQAARDQAAQQAADQAAQQGQPSGEQGAATQGQTGSDTLPSDPSNPGQSNPDQSNPGPTTPGDLQPFQNAPQNQNDPNSVSPGSGGASGQDNSSFGQP
ncbi:transglycosylase domain-containing protein [Deinococcus altitudinis]|uniref:transglycosylase domain-containing protein n=1 Tax=Deinococcus altitudinis TaxID=468914 RepID=UPI003891EADD